MKQILQRLTNLFIGRIQKPIVPDKDQCVIQMLEIQLKQARRDRDRKEKELNELYLFINGFEQRHEKEMDGLRTALHDALKFTCHDLEEQTGNEQNK